MDPTFPARYRRKPGVIETDLGAELILLDPASQEMFSLNPAGALVWREVEEASAAALADRIADTFVVGAGEALEDVRAHLRVLEDAGLIVAAE